ncbi:MAG TPA: hypothetical protein VGF51_02135 [Acidimicrobiales bacterium]
MPKRIGRMRGKAMKRVRVRFVFASVFCVLVPAVMAIQPEVGASNTSTQVTTSLQSWYQKTGHSVLQAFVADARRFAHVTSSTTPREASQDCKRFTTDVLAAEHKKLPPNSVLASDYRYYLQTAATRFKECVTGIAEKSEFELAEGAQGGSLAAQAAMTIIRGTQSGKVVNLPPSSTNLLPSLSASVVVPKCYADFKSLEVAIEAYNAQNNAFPAPPAAWNAATYSGNFAPLLSSKGGGPYLNASPDSGYYVIEYDSSGNVWVEPAGQFDTTYNPAHGDYTACADVAK